MLPWVPSREALAFSPRRLTQAPYKGLEFRNRLVGPTVVGRVSHALEWRVNRHSQPGRTAGKPFTGHRVLFVLFSLLQASAMDCSRPYRPVA